MRTNAALLLILFSLFAPVTTNASNLPIPENFSVEYILKSGLFTIGKTKRSLSLQEDGRYLFESYTRPAGMLSVFFKGAVTERSVWDYHDREARPINYTYVDTNGKKKRDVSLVFDWENFTVTNKINGDPWDMKITPDTQDKLLYQLNIMLKLQEDSNLKTLKFSVADGGILKSYEAKTYKKELIETPAGNFKTIKIQREDGKKITTLWCAPSLNYLPVRIEHVEKGRTRVNAYLTKVTGLP